MLILQKAEFILIAKGKFHAIKTQLAKAKTYVILYNYTYSRYHPVNSFILIFRNYEI